MQNRESDRREFLKTAGTMAVAAGALPAVVLAADKSKKKKATPETIVAKLYKSMSDEQKKTVCFDWKHQDDERGLLRTHVSNNWQITKPKINSKFFTKDQQEMIRAIYEGIISPDWHAKFDKQLKDDAGGYGKSQSIAMFGNPGDGKFEFVLTGRHMTMRCDGNSEKHVAFGGPIFYGHAAQGFNEKPNHPGNVFWEQALAANKVYKMLDGKQRKLAEVPETPEEDEVAFRGKKGKFTGIPVSELSSDQKAEVQKVLKKLVEPYRQTDRNEVNACLKAQGGLDKCHLSFYTDKDIGKDKVWDNWRLEGPAFVWHYRGAPHVHVWANIADNPKVKTNAIG